MPTPTAAERLHAQHQKIRKASGLPDPSEYKKKLDAMKTEEVNIGDKVSFDHPMTAIPGKTTKKVGTVHKIEGDMAHVKVKDKYGVMTHKKNASELKKEEVEPLDEISPQLKASYVAGAKKQIKQSLPFTKKTDEYRDIAKNFIAKRQKGIAKANEEVELLDEMPESNMKTKDVHSHLKKSGWSLARSKGGHDVYKHPKAKHSIPVPRHNQLKAPLIRGIMKASKVEEQLEKKGRFVSGPMKQPFKSNTILTSVKEATDEREYDYEGDMAKSDLRSIIHNAQTLHDMLDDNTNLAEWVQSKITLAEDYISTVANYMRSEMNEEVVQEDKNDYQRKIEKNNKKFIAASKRQKNPLTNVHTAQTKQKPVKEDVELDEMIVVKTNKPIGTRVADIGPGGKEYNVKTNKAYDDAKKKQPQGADFAAQRRKERLAKSGRMDEEQHSVLYKMKKDDKKIAVAHYKLKDDAHKFLSSVKTKGGNGIVRSKTNEEVELNEKKNLPGLWANIHAKRKRGEPPAKPGDKDYPKTLNIESAAEPTEGEMKGKQQMSRRAQIVKDAVKGKKADSSDKFQKDPELSSEIHKT